MLNTISYIDETSITDKKILLRVDFNVSLNPNNTIADDARIQQALPTFTQLLKNNNKLIVVSHLGRPESREPEFSLQPVAERLQNLLPGYTVKLVDDFLTADPAIFQNQQPNEILMLENIRFYPEEQKGDTEFSQKLAALADVYVNDAFGVSHRADASIVGVTSYLPSYGGLLMKKEIQMIGRVIQNPEKPFVAIIGGAKITTKITILGKLMEMADYLLVGGGLANTFLCAQGFPIGKSYCESEGVETAKKLLFLAAQLHTAIVLPSDVVIQKDPDNEQSSEVVKQDEVPEGAQVLDIGPETQAKFGAIIAKAKTIIWNGPVGLFEKEPYRRGTDFIYYAITQNSEALSVVGGGDTLAAIDNKEYLNKITHISTGGGAMLEYIENGTLPGIEALKTGQRIAA
ncbi:phosphoglycerate kinase [Candidatus Roizmanbacteria bacterium]|nr:phosphoglycerate kinase [Candidatus Roizmanbacteria bacterium]